MKHKITMHEWWGSLRKSSIWYRWECKCGAGGNWSKSKSGAKSGGAMHAGASKR